MKKVLLFSIVFSVFIIQNSLFTTPAFAQSANTLNVTVSPVYLDLNTDPGKTINQTIRIRNNSSSPINFGITVDKLVPKGDTVAPAAATSQDTYLSWIKFDKDNVNALPLEWTDVKLSINVPADAAFGYYYAVHLGQQATDNKPNQSGAKVLGEVVVPILLTVKNPNTVASAKLVSFSSSSFVNEFLPINFQATVTNDGNVHVAPRGNIFIRTSGGKDVGVIDINGNAGNILPSGQRQFMSSWDDGFIVNKPVTDSNGKTVVDKNGQPVTALTINWDKLTKLRIGKYSASMVMVYDNGTRDVTLESSTTFWILPWKILGGIFIGLIIVVFVIKSLLRSYIRSQIRRGK